MVLDNCLDESINLFCRRFLRQAKMEREARREEKEKLVAMRLAAKEAKLEAERVAQEMEDKLLEGLDELDRVLMRQTLRRKVAKFAHLLLFVGCSPLF